MNEKKRNRYMPLIMALCVVFGIFIGTFYANHFTGNRLSIINSGSNKLNNLLHIIDAQYVDTVDVNDLVEKAMPQILSELDPHSVYIAAKDVQIANDDLRGHHPSGHPARATGYQQRTCRKGGRDSWRQDCEGGRQAVHG